MQVGVPTIVVVDDAAEVRLLVKTRLRLSGSVTVVGEGADGTEAVALASEHRPSLLLLDVSMPVMDGFEALPRVLEASPDTRVVLYSGFDEEGLAQRARELGAAAFIEKSSSIDALVEDLLAILEPLTGAAAGGIPKPSRDTRPVSTASDQQVLDEHLERFREGFEEAAIGMATMTLNGRLVRVNRAFTRLLRRPSEGLVGAAYADLTEGRDAAVAIALEDIHRRGKDVVQVEHQVPAHRTDARSWPRCRRCGTRAAVRCTSFFRYRTSQPREPPRPSSGRARTGSGCSSRRSRTTRSSCSRRKATS